ncbi:MAG: hypothetical protein R2705_04730 [Ilumatobacteraceae bacterium]
MFPEHVISPLDGLVEALGADRVRFAMGAVVQVGIEELALGAMTNPVTGEPGHRATFIAADGTVLFEEDRRSTALVYFGGDAPVRQSAKVVFHTKYRCDADATLNPASPASIGPRSRSTDA